MTTNTKPVKPDFQIAAKHAHEFDINAVAFMALKAEQIGEDPGEGGYGYELERTEVVWARRGRTVRVLVPIALVIYRAAPGVRANLVRVEVSTRADYSMADESLSDEAIAHFAGMNAFLHVWPYVRAEVQSLTTKLALPPLVLPLVMANAVPNLVANVRMATDESAAPAATEAPRRKRAKAKRSA